MIPQESTKVESEKMHRMENLRACLIQDYLDKEVDLAVLFQELTKLVGLLGRIGDSYRAQRLSVSEQEFLV